MTHRLAHSAVFSTLLLASSAVCQGWLQAPRLYPQFTDLRAAADLDGDGDLDLLASEYDPGLTATFLVPQWNQGGGRFVAGARQPLPLATRNFWRLADCDGDQQPDLLVTSFVVQPTRLEYWRGLPNGSFAAPVTLPTSGNIIETFVGDANGDALADVAVLVNGAAGYALEWALGVPAGVPTIGPATSLGAGFFPSSTALLDLDGDGDDDAAVLGSQDVRRFVTTNGQFGAAGSWPIANSNFGSLVTADHDGDHDDDLVMFSTTNFLAMDVTRFTNQGNGVFTVVAQSLPQPLFGYLRPGDWDGDGDDDVMLRTLSSTSDGELYLFTSGGGSGYSLAWSSDYQLPGTGEPGGCCDLDGDGALDFVDVRAFLFGDGTAEDPVGPARIGVHGVFDWEGDGDPDLPIARGELLRNDGSGAMTTEVASWPSSPGPNQMFGDVVAFGDFDGDGRREALVPLFGQTTTFPQQIVFDRMHRFEEDLAGHWLDLGPATASGGPGMATPAYAVDTNGDGILDLVDRTGVWANNGSHQFTRVATPFGNYVPLRAGDVDGDGATDFLAGWFGATQGLAILRQLGNHAFAVDVIQAPLPQSLAYHTPALHDFDDDGDLDIASDLSWASGEFALWWNQGNGTFVAGPTFLWNGRVVTTAVLGGDVDGDGATDLLFDLGDTLRVLRRNGPGPTWDPPVDFRVSHARGVADLDGDGDLDVLGTGVTWNRSVPAASAGARRQYGQAANGSGGIQPVLGISPPLRAGATPVLHLRQAVGGSFSFLALGFQAASVPSPVLPGLVHYTYPIVAVAGFSVAGAPGVPGAGMLDMPVAVPAGLVGVTVRFQSFVVDAGCLNGLAHSNGLELTLGQ